MHETIGDAELYCGDCLDILPTLGKVDAVITDPPYNAKNIGPNKRVYENQVMQLATEDYIEFCNQWFVKASKISKRVVFTSGIANICYYPQPHWIICWHKPASVSFNRMGGFNAWEPILIYGKPVKRLGQDYWLVNTMNFKKGYESMHPCPKPIILVKKIVDAFLMPGEIVVDAFMGSGTTGVACMNLGRKFIGIEIEPKYFDIACKRIEEAYKQPRLFEEEPIKQEQVEMYK